MYSYTLRNRLCYLFVPTCSVWYENFFRETGVVRRITYTVINGKFLWGTGLTPKHLGLAYGPLYPPNSRQFPPSSPEAPRTEWCESLY
jgi:hypothetical protein